MLTYPWKCTVLHCNHLGNTWKPLVLMTRHFDYCLSVSEGDNQSVRSSAPVVSRCFPGGYNVKLYISRGRLAWWLLYRLFAQCILVNVTTGCIASKTQVHTNSLNNQSLLLQLGNLFFYEQHRRCKATLLHTTYTTALLQTDKHFHCDLENISQT